MGIEVIGERIMGVYTDSDGDIEHGYVRWNCYHGLPHDEIKEECQPGCSKCRISLNLRYARSPFE